MFRETIIVPRPTGFTVFTASFRRVIKSCRSGNHLVLAPPSSSPAAHSGISTGPVCPAVCQSGLVHLPWGRPDLDLCLTRQTFDPAIGSLSEPLDGFSVFLTPD